MGRIRTTRQAREIRADVMKDLRHERLRQEILRDWRDREEEQVWLHKMIQQQRHETTMAKFRHRRPKL